ncbi:MAG: hydrogenase iron-sulfur subunit [bacterium]
MKNPKIHVFCCENAINKGSFDQWAHLIRVPCSGSLDEVKILQAFQDGADGVLIFACYEGACKYLSGNVMAKKRIDYTKRIIEETGIERKRIQMHYVQCNQEEKIQEIFKAFENTLSKQ